MSPKRRPTALFLVLLCCGATAQSAEVTPSCAARVPQPYDYSPRRSPQAVHTKLLKYFLGRRIVEIGSTEGDGIACFASVAQSAISIEVDSNQCKILEKRGLERGFTVQCRTYEARCVDADVYTWWSNPPQLQNAKVVAFLNACIANRTLREDVRAVIIFDHQLRADKRRLAVFQALPGARAEQVSFDESKDCNQRMANATTRFQQYVRGKMCGRARGVFSIVSLMPQSVAQAIVPFMKMDAHGG